MKREVGWAFGEMHQLPGGDERFFYVQLLPSGNLLHVVTSVMEIKA